MSFLEKIAKEAYLNKLASEKEQKILRAKKYLNKCFGSSFYNDFVLVLEEEKILFKLKKSNIVLLYEEYIETVSKLNTSQVENIKTILITAQHFYLLNHNKHCIFEIPVDDIESLGKALIKKEEIEKQERDMPF